MAVLNTTYELPESLRRRLEEKETPYIFSRNAQKSKVFNKPLLIIGLGGSGYDALSRAKEKMVSCFETNDKGELEGIEFLEIDTDSRDRDNSLKEHKPGTLTENEFKIFQNADIGAILRNRDSNTDILPEEIDEWLDPDIPVAQIVHGAAGIRQAGRLLLHLNAVEIIDEIKNKLDKIRQSVILSKEPVNVVIFTGIGGGTGSGIFVDVSYIVRQCIKMFSGQAFITGIMLMPDILFEDPKVDKLTKENIKRNGFAALKELDYLMNLSETQDTFTQSFPGGFVVEKTNEAIFDRCVLVSSMVEGRLLLPNAKEHAYNIAAEMLIDMVSNSTIVSKGSNDVSRKDIALTNMKDRKPVNYVYTAVGGQAVYFDFDMVFNIFIKNVFESNLEINYEEINDTIDKLLEENGFKEAIEELKSNRDAFSTNSRDLYELVDKKSGIPAPKNVKISFIRKHYRREYEPIVKNKSLELYEEDLKAFERMGDQLYEKLARIRSVIKSPNDAIIDSMRNRIRKELDETKEKNEKKEEESELHIYTEKLQAIRTKERKKRKKKGFNLSKLFGGSMDIDNPNIALEKISNEQAVILKNEAYNRMIENQIKKIGQLFSPKNEGDSKPKSEEMLSFYNTARSTWKEIMESKYEGENFMGSAVEAVWERFDGIFGESSVVSNANFKDKKFNNINFRNITANQYIETIDKLIRANYKQTIDKAAKEYKKKMTDNALAELYQGETGISPDITTGQIFESYFEDVKISLDEVIMSVFEIKKPEIADVWREVVQSILKNSDVLYSKRAMKDGEVFERPGYSEFMIPDGNKILASVYKELTGQDAEISDIRHRISCMRYTQCQKIDDYIYIDELERVYNRSNSKCGLHLYENMGDRWAKLPSPVYRNKRADYLWMDKYEDAKIAEKYRYIFAKAYDEKHMFLDDSEHGLIAYDKDTKKMCIDAKKLKEMLDAVDKTSSYVPPRDGKVYICTMERNESKDINSYVSYCMDWFIKMFRYRELVGKAMNVELENITDEDLEEMFNQYMQIYALEGKANDG